jgi:plastocyanin
VGWVPPSTSSSLNVTAVANYGFQPDTFENVPTNATITVTFTDDDVLQHSFAIVGWADHQIPNSDSDSQLGQVLATYPPLDYALVNGKGDVNITSFHSPATPGWYEFVCNVTGHFQLGMYGFIAFGENLPTNLTLPTRTGLGGSTFNALDYAATGGAALVALVVIYLVWRHRVPPRKSPPGSRS